MSSKRDYSDFPQVSFKFCSFVLLLLLLLLFSFLWKFSSIVTFFSNFTLFICHSILIHKEIGATHWLCFAFFFCRHFTKIWIPSFYWQIERSKIDEMRIPEKVTFTLPSCDASVMRLTTKLLKQSDAVEVLLETEQLRASLPLVSYKFKLDLWTVKGLRHCIEKIMKFQGYFGSVLWYNFWDILHWKKKNNNKQTNQKKRDYNWIESDLYTNSTLTSGFTFNNS